MTEILKRLEFYQESHRNDIVSFQGHHVKRFMISICHTRLSRRIISSRWLYFISSPLLFNPLFSGFIVHQSIKTPLVKDTINPLVFQCKRNILPFLFSWTTCSQRTAKNSHIFHASSRLLMQSHTFLTSNFSDCFPSCSWPRLVFHRSLYMGYWFLPLAYTLWWTKSSTSLASLPLAHTCILHQYCQHICLILQFMHTTVFKAS